MFVEFFYYIEKQETSPDEWISGPVNFEMKKIKSKSIFNSWNRECYHFSDVMQ